MNNILLVGFFNNKQFNNKTKRRQFAFIGKIYISLLRIDHVVRV